jgi:hypothetical protein
LPEQLFAPADASVMRRRIFPATQCQFSEKVATNRWWSVSSWKIGSRRPPRFRTLVALESLSAQANGRSRHDIGGKSRGKGRHYMGNKVPVVSLVKRGGRDEAMRRVSQIQPAKKPAKRKK